MSNKLILFTIPSNMSSIVEQIKEIKPTGEQPVSSSIEGSQPVQKVEVEKTSETLPKEQKTVSQDPTPQTYSAMQEDFVEDKGGIGAISKSEWRSELDIKSGRNYSVDITTISKD
jgi:hypothetical protein